MLELLRRGAQTWVAKALLLVLVVSFALFWGASSAFNMMGTPSNVVARVGDQQITDQTFDREFKAQIRYFSRQLGQPLTVAQARQFGLDKQVLQRLIALNAMDAEAKQLGLQANDKLLAEQIIADPDFKGAFGRFDRRLFAERLQQSDMNEKAYLAERRVVMVRNQLFQAVEKGTQVPQSIVDAIFKYQDEIRVADYVILPNDAAGNIADPDEKTLEAFYKTQSQNFINPETRDFTVIALSPKDLAATISLSDQELQDAFKKRHAEFDTPELRLVDQIPFATEADAKAAVERLRKGTSIEALAKERGLSMDDISLGNISRDKMLSPELADAAFSLKVGTYSEPVQGPLGFVVLHVAAVTPGVAHSYDEVKDKLKASIAEERARSQVYDVQSGIEDQFAGGASLEEVAAKSNLKIVKLTGITARGTSLDGKPAANLPTFPKLVETVFASEVGDQVPPGDTGDGGYYWIRVDNVKASAVRPLSEIRTEVIAAWKEAQRREKLTSFGQALVARGNKGESIAKLAAEVKGKVVRSGEMRRFEGTDAVSRNALAELFAVPKGQFVLGPTGKGDALVLMQLRDIQNLAIDRSSPTYKQLEGQLQEAYQDDMLTTFAQGAEAEHGFKIYQDTLARLSATESAQ